MGGGRRHRRGWSLGLASRADLRACWVRRGMGTARRRMASLRLERVGRAWLPGSGFDLEFGRGPGWGPGTVRRESSVGARSGQSPRWRGGRPPAEIELLGELPCGLDYSSGRLTLLCDGLL